MERMQHYYTVKYVGFQIIAGCVIAVFLLIGISLHFAVLVKEKRKRTSAVVGTAAIVLFAAAYFGVCVLGNGRDADLKYFSFSSPSGEYSIVTSEARDFLGNGRISAFQRINAFLMREKGHIQTIDRWNSPFSDNLYSIEWGDGQVTVHYWEEEWEEKIALFLAATSSRNGSAGKDAGQPCWMQLGQVFQIIPVQMSGYKY